MAKWDEIVFPTVERMVSTSFDGCLYTLLQLRKYQNT